MLAHTEAVEARIKSVPALASKTFILTAPKDAQGKITAVAPYCVVQPADGIDERPRFSGPLTRSTPRFVLHLVGSSYDNAQKVTELVKAKFIGSDRVPIQVDVTNETGSHLYWRAPLPTQKDDSVTPPLIYNTIELGWISDLNP